MNVKKSHKDNDERNGFEKKVPTKDIFYCIYLNDSKGEA